MRIAIAFSIVLGLAAPALGQATTPSDMLRTSVVEYIRPQFEALATRGGALSEALNALCAEPEEQRLEDARAAFAAAVSAYGHVEFLRIGPLLEDNRADRLLFWPDRRGIGLKQVQEVLAAEDPAATNLPGLQQKSVAVQGLGALEFVLFGTGAEDLVKADGAYRCQFGETIAANVSQISGELVAAWADPEGIATRLMEPDPTNADYRTTTEALEAVVGLVAHGLENMRDTRINPFIAKADGKANPRQALFWRSSQTMTMLRANIEGMRALMELSDVAGEADLAAKIAAAFDKAEAALARVSAPPEEAVSDPAQASALSDLVLASQELQTLIGEDLSATLGLSVGFSSLDGD